MKADARAAWRLIKGDGCTAAPEFTFTPCCDEHDRHYMTHTEANGRSITRAEADRRFLECCRRNAPPIPILGPLLPFIYFAAVRLFGGRYWRKNQKPE